MLSAAGTMFFTLNQRVTVKTTLRYASNIPIFVSVPAAPRALGIDTPAALGFFGCPFINLFSVAGLLLEVRNCNTPSVGLNAKKYSIRTV